MSSTLLLVFSPILAAVAQAASAPPPPCPAFAELPGLTRGTVAVDSSLPWLTGSQRVLASPQGGWRITPRSGAAVLFAEGYLAAPLEVDANGQACPVELIEGAAPRVEVRVDLSVLPPEAGAWIEGCGNTVPLRQEHVELPVVEGACELRVMATDHKWDWAGEPVQLHASEGEVLELELALGEPVAAVGVWLEPHPKGGRIVSFPAGSAGPDSGLARGDVIVRIDGEPLAGLAGGPLHAALLGDEGDPARVQLADGEILTVLRTRRDHSFTKGNVGIRVEQVGDLLVVAEVAGPAARRGILPGDVVLASDGTPAEEWTAGRLTLHWRGGGLRRLHLQRGEVAYSRIVELTWFNE